MATLADTKTYLAGSRIRGVFTGCSLLNELRFDL